MIKCGENDIYNFFKPFSYWNKDLKKNKTIVTSTLKESLFKKQNNRP